MGNNLEGKMHARQIVDATGMSSRPEFYSGRGAILDDLDSRYLEKIYNGIEKEHGEEAAKQYIQMVADIPELSATDFLLTLYRLESHDWKWDKGLLGNEHGRDVGPDDENGARVLVGFATIAGALYNNSQIDQTMFIRGEFLKNHGVKIPKSKDSWYGTSYD